MAAWDPILCSLDIFVPNEREDGLVKENEQKGWSAAYLLVLVAGGKALQYLPRPGH